MTGTTDEPDRAGPPRRAGSPSDGGRVLDLTARPERSVRTLLPILGWLPRYNWGRDSVRDLVAGVALAALVIPESLGYAGVAGVPAELGLYAALAAILACAVTGGTSILVVGPASGVAALSGSIIAELGGDADTVVLAAALATTSGVILLAAHPTHRPQRVKRRHTTPRRRDAGHDRRRGRRSQPDERSSADRTGQGAIIRELVHSKGRVTPSPA